MKTLVILTAILTTSVIANCQTDSIETKTTNEDIFNEWERSDFELKIIEKSSKNDDGKESNDWVTFSNGFKGVTINSKSNKKKTKSFEGHYTSFDLGLSTIMSKSKGFSMPDSLKLLTIDESRSLEISWNAFQVEIPFTNNMGIVTGIGMTWNNYRFDNPNTKLIHNKDGSFGITEDFPKGKEWNKSKLSTYKISIPLLYEVQYQDFWFQVGGFGSVKLGTKNKMKATDKSKYVLHRSFHTNPVQYGVMVRMGYDNFGIYANYSFAPYFKKSASEKLTDLSELYTVSLGLTLWLDY